MKEHFQKAWDHVPHQVQRLLTSGAVGALIAVATTLFSDVMKQFPGVQAPPMPGQPNPPGQQSANYQNGQRSSGYWTGNEQHRRHHSHHHYEGRS